MTDRGQKETDAQRRVKRSYVPPAIEWEETLDVRTSLAVACGKTAGRSPICNAAPTS